MMSHEWIQLYALIIVIILAIDLLRRAVSALVRLSRERRVLSGVDLGAESAQPWVSVLVYSQNQADLLEQTVCQVSEIRYRAFDIVAISDRSVDDTVAQLKDYISRTGKPQQLSLLRRRVAGTRAAAYLAGYRKSRRGDIVILLKAGDVVDGSLIDRAVARRTGRGLWHIDIKGTEDPAGLMGLADSFRSVFWGRPAQVIGCLPAELRRLGAIHDQPASSRRLWLSLAGWVSVLACLLMVAFWRPMALWYAWMVFSLYLLALSLLYAGMLPAVRRKLMFAIPAAMFVVPVTGVIAAVSRLLPREISHM